MNERIKELANQLGPVATIGNWGRVEWADNVYPQLGDKMYAAIDLEKFAELMVRECMRMCDVAAIGYESHGHMKEANGCYSAKEYIEEHFGVE